tara:strand:+ start:3213 stop:3533 length:321 start_codon:yes stop_codon:yes gene_type:complete
LIVKAIKEKKGRDIMILNLQDIMNSPCSFFVICSATSKTQINAIANNIGKLLFEKFNLKIWSEEGRSSNWRLIDYVDIVVHILQDEAREYYKLEELWGDAIIKKIN